MINFNAQCLAGIVTTQKGEIIAGCEILGEGVGPSQGVVIISDQQPFYIPKITPDITVIIDNLLSDLNSVNSALAAIQGSLVANDSGASSAAPVAAAVANITANIVLLQLLKAAQR